MNRRIFILALPLLICSCEGESTFPLAPRDITVGPLYSYINNPVIKAGEKDDDFDNQSISSPSVVEAGKKLIMYFTAINKDGIYSIGRAESDDGIVWIKNENPVIVADTDNFSEKVVKEPSAIYDGQKITLFFVSITKENRYRIMIASSDDGLNFSRSDKELITIPYSDLKLDKIAEPSVTFKDNGLVMYYTAMDEENRAYIFVAKATLENPLSFISESRSPIFVPQTGNTNAFDQYAVMSASVLSIKSANNRTLYRMYYCGSAVETGAYHIGLAGSFDGENFERYAYNPILHYGRSPSAILFNNNLFVFYNELPEGESKGISVATTIKIK
ncbi:MAG: hypothetical protein ACPL7I_02215 [Myxococcota bacterium]